MGLVNDWWSFLTISLNPKLYTSAEWRHLKTWQPFQTYWTEIRAKRRCIWRKRTLTFKWKFESLLSFPTKFHDAVFINIIVTWQCVQIKTFMGDFRSVYCSILFLNGVHFFTFCKNCIRISCHIIFVNKHWPQSWTSSFKAKVLNKLDWCMFFMH